MRYIYYLLPLLLLCSGIDAQEAPKTSVEPPLESVPPEFREIEEAARQDEGEHFTQSLLKMLATLGMMVALIYIISYMLKKAMNKSQHKINETSGIKILESRSLNQRTAIYLVEVQGKKYLLAESNSGAILLDRLPSA